VTPIIARKSYTEPAENFASFFRNAYYNVTMSRAYLFWLSFLMILTIADRWIPLQNTLGYEFSAEISWFIFIIAAIFTTHEFERLRPVLFERSPYSPGPHSRIVVWGVVLGILVAIFWMLLLPMIGIFAIGWIFSIRNCDPLSGFGFYLAIPVVTSVLGVSIATIASLATGSRRAALGLFFLVLFIFFVRIVIRIGFGHVMNPTDPVLGFTVLPMYESETNLTNGFILSRIFLLVISWFLINIAILFADSRFQVYGIKYLPANFRKPDLFLPEIQSTLLTFLLAVLGFWFQGPMGMEVTRNYLEHVLDGKLVTDHFIISYPTGGEVEDDIDRIAEDHEFYYHQIYKELGVAPRGLIRAYIYPDRVMKTRLTGAGSNVFAKPWTGEIHVEYSRNTIDSLKHELAHVISAPMGLPFFGSSMLGGYGEGIAEGINWEATADLLPHTWAAAVREADDPLKAGSKLFPRETTPYTLFPENTWWFKILASNGESGGFYGGRIGMNYTVSASYNRWFIDTFGIEAYRKAYVRNDTEAATGMSAKETVERWMDYLDHVPLMRSEIDYAGLAYAPPKFTMQVCAHEVVKHQRLASEYTEKRDWESAYEEYVTLGNFSPGNIGYGFQQAKMLFNMDKPDKFDEALELIADLKTWEGADASWQSYLAILEGDVYARTGQKAQASEMYQRALDGSLSQSASENVMLRFEILNSPAIDEFMAAFKEPDAPRWRYERARELDDSWLPLYYIGTSLVADRMYPEGEEMLLECLRKNPERDFVRRNCLYYLGVCAYRNEEYALAKQNFQDAGVIAQEMYVRSHPAWDGVIPLDRLDSWVMSVQDWLDKCDWRENIYSPAE